MNITKDTVKLSELSRPVRYAIERYSGANNLQINETMSTSSALERWLGWHGIHGYLGGISEILEKSELPRCTHVSARNQRHVPSGIRCLRLAGHLGNHQYKEKSDEV